MQRNNSSPTLAFVRFIRHKKTFRFIRRPCIATNYVSGSLNFCHFGNHHEMPHLSFSSRGFNPLFIMTLNLLETLLLIIFRIFQVICILHYIEFFNVNCSGTRQNFNFYYLFARYGLKKAKETKVSKRQIDTCHQRTCTSYSRQSEITCKLVRKRTTSESVTSNLSTTNG